MGSMGGTVSRVLRSGDGLGGCVEGLLLGDGDFLFLGREVPRCLIERVAVGGTSLQGGHVAEAIQWDWLAVAVAGLELGEFGDGVVVGLRLRFGRRVRRGAG